MIHKFITTLSSPLSVCWKTCQWPLSRLIVLILFATYIHGCFKSRLCITHLHSWHYFTGWLGSLAVSRGVKGGGSAIYDSVLLRSHVPPRESRPGRYSLSLLAAWAFSDYRFQVFSLYIYKTPPTCKTFYGTTAYVLHMICYLFYVAVYSSMCFLAPTSCSKNPLI
jgi:hypothetical protein